MTGAEFASAGERLALAHAAIHPDGAAWLAAWRADDPAAADELAEWELEGHPFTNWPPRIALRARLEQTVERLIAMLDALDGDPDIEDGADAEPSLGAPEGHDNQLVWLRGSDTDQELVNL